MPVSPDSEYRPQTPALIENPYQQLKGTNLPLEPLTAISPIDGRDSKDTAPLRVAFSEFALFRGRVWFEANYMEALSDRGILPSLTTGQREFLNDMWRNFSIEDGRRIKEIEDATRHDVKATEYFMKEKFAGTSLAGREEMVHLGTTSSDDDNVAVSAAIKFGKNEILVPSAWGMVDTLVGKAKELRNNPMLGRTHGKDAPATTMSKELTLYALRLAKKARQLEEMSLTGKLTGVVGNFHELNAMRPDIDWIKFSYEFIDSLGLEPLLFTTQIEPHDRWAEIFNKFTEACTVVITTDKNIWTYMSHDYFTLPQRAKQTGSSVMPHKGRNPIDLEKGEGNAQWARGLFHILADELPDSRMQRHLSDSTVSRNIGVAMAHTKVAFDRSASDIRDLIFKEDEALKDLDGRYGILTAGVQTNLRYLGVPEPYELLDALAKQGPVTQARLHQFIDEFPDDQVSQEQKDRMKSWKPDSEIGYAPRLRDMMLEEIEGLKLGQKV